MSACAAKGNPRAGGPNGPPVSVRHVVGQYGPADVVPGDLLVGTVEAAERTAYGSYAVEWMPDGAAGLIGRPLFGWSAEPVRPGDRVAALFDECKSFRLRPATRRGGGR